ncbi:MAG TPA: hypothetical protein VGG01_10085 [Xanthobacteraceae bacterium]
MSIVMRFRRDDRGAYSVNWTISASAASALALPPLSQHASLA